MCRQECWSLETCLSTLQQSLTYLPSPSIPDPPRDRRTFWAAYRAWPHNTRVPAGPAASLLRPSPAEQPGSTASSPDPLASPSSASPGQVQGREVYLALVEAMTEPGVVAAAAEVFRKAVRRRAGLTGL